MNDINYMAVVLAAIANMGVGFLWFGPLFGKKWVRTGGRKEMVENQKVKGGAKKGYIIAILASLGSLIFSYVLAHFIILTAPMAAFWIWIGILIPISLGRMLWDGKPWMLLDAKSWIHWIIVNGYYLVSLLLMGWILA